MTKLRNPKADILWEATRRNENYKKGYYDALKKYQKEYPDQPRENFKRLPSPDTDRWKIRMVGTNPITKNRFCSFYWLDPNIQLEEIWNDVLEKASTWEHPYNHLFPNKILEKALRKNSEKNTGKKYRKVFLDSYYYNELHGFEEDGYVQFNNYQRISEPQNITNDLMLEDFFEFEADNTVYTAIKRKYTKNKILLMIDPFETDENIKIKVKETKNHILQSVKTTYKRLESQGKVLLEPSKMNNYFEWFERYDEIINEAKEAANKESKKGYKYKLDCKDGANLYRLKGKTDFTLNQLVPDSQIDIPYTAGKKYDIELDKKIKADEKKYGDAYENIVKLIQQTPNIIFKPPAIK